MAIGRKIPSECPRGRSRPEGSRSLCSPRGRRSRPRCDHGDATGIAYDRRREVGAAVRDEVREAWADEELMPAHLLEAGGIERNIGP